MELPSFLVGLGGAYPSREYQTGLLGHGHYLLFGYWTPAVGYIICLAQSAYTFGFFCALHRGFVYARERFTYISEEFAQDGA
jgi:hypothetical protein